MDGMASGVSRRSLVIGGAACVAGAALAGAAGSERAGATEVPEGMRAYILDNGRSPEMAESTMYQVPKGREEQTIRIPYYTVLIQTPQGTVLFDAGCNDTERQLENVREGMQLSDEQKFPACLEPTGVTADEIDYVVLSHLHMDHFGYVDQFPNAEVLVSVTEFAETCKAIAAGTYWYTADMEYFLEAPIRWRLVPDQDTEFELLPGLTVYNFGPGHSFGMLGLMADLPNTGKVLLPSDALCFLGNLDDKDPLLPPERTYDFEKDVATIARIKELAAEQGAQVWPAHDLEWFEDMTKATEGYYD